MRIFISNDEKVQNELAEYLDKKILLTRNKIIEMQDYLNALQHQKTELSQSNFIPNNSLKK